jgi:hypothetical protein
MERQFMGAYQQSRCGSYGIAGFWRMPSFILRFNHSSRSVYLLLRPLALLLLEMEASETLENALFPRLNSVLNLTVAVKLASDPSTRVSAVNHFTINKLIIVLSLFRVICTRLCSKH